MNLFRPKQILDELWRATAPVDRGETAPTATRTPLTSMLANIAAAGLAYRLVSTLTARQNLRVSG